MGQKPVSPRAVLGADATSRASGGDQRPLPQRRCPWASPGDKRPGCEPLPAWPFPSRSAGPPCILSCLLCLLLPPSVPFLPWRILPFPAGSLPRHPLLLLAFPGLSPSVGGLLSMGSVCPPSPTFRQGSLVPSSHWPAPCPALAGSSGANIRRSEMPAGEGGRRRPRRSPALQTALLRTQDPPATARQRGGPQGRFVRFNAALMQPLRCSLHCC